MITTLAALVAVSRYTDFRRTKTFCQGGYCCNYDLVRQKTDAGDGWERTKSI